MRSPYAAAVALLTALACSGDRVRPAALEPETPDAGAGTGAGSGGGGLPSTGVNAKTLTVTGMRPRSGPFSGGNEAIVRGSGFTEDALVFIGGRMVQPRDTLLVDRNSLRVTVPAGRVGPADVRVVIGDDEATAEDAYVYSALLLEPTRGSIAGGTSVLITIDELEFEAGVQVEFGGTPCSEPRVITPHQLRCKTPANRVGPVDVRVVWPDEDRAEVVAEDAFEYLDFADTAEGGLSGGPIAGTLNVTVIDTAFGFAVPNAFVVIGDDPDGPYRGFTNERGQITFSGEDLEGPVSVHVIVPCMERSSIVSFNAEHATIYVTPVLDPRCGKPGEPTGGGGGRGTAGSVISGELIFPGSDEFAVNDWRIVPPPRDDEVRVAYVFTTRSHRLTPEPSPDVPGTNARVLEGAPVGRRGYPYSIFARPAGLAVYALAGLERRTTGEFIPYVMGVARDVVTAPGQESIDVDIVMDIPLDRELQVSLTDLPPPVARGPSQYRAQVLIDLGGEGVMVRQVNQGMLDVRSSLTDASLFRFFAQPALIRSLSDARYQVVAGWYTNESNDPPYTQAVQLGIKQTDEPVFVKDLLAIPVATSPLHGSRLPADRVLRWELAGDPPDFYMVEVIGGDNLPAWLQIVPGTQTESPIPDFSSVEGLSDIAEGVIAWQVRAIRVPDFTYDQFKYNLLSARHWTHTSVDTFSTER